MIGLRQSSTLAHAPHILDAPGRRSGCLGFREKRGLREDRRQQHNHTPTADHLGRWHNARLRRMRLIAAWALRHDATTVLISVVTLAALARAPDQGSADGSDRSADQCSLGPKPWRRYHRSDSRTTRSADYRALLGCGASAKSNERNHQNNSISHR